MAFRTTDCVSTRIYVSFAAQWLAYTLPYRRFACILANACARLGADVDRYSFIAVDFHHLLFAGLPAHLLKNSFFREAETPQPFIRCGTRIRLGGHQETSTVRGRTCGRLLMRCMDRILNDIRI